MSASNPALVLRRRRHVDRWRRAALLRGRRRLDARHERRPQEVLRIRGERLALARRRRRSAARSARRHAETVISRQPMRPGNASSKNARFRQSRLRGRPRRDATSSGRPRPDAGVTTLEHSQWGGPAVERELEPAAEPRRIARCAHLGAELVGRDLREIERSAHRCCFRRARCPCSG